VLKSVEFSEDVKADLSSSEEFLAPSQKRIGCFHPEVYVVPKFDTIEEDFDGASSEVDITDSEEVQVQKFEFEVADLDPEENGGVLDVKVVIRKKLFMFLT